MSTAAEEEELPSIQSKLFATLTAALLAGSSMGMGLGGRAFQTYHMHSCVQLALSFG
jgi:hypothetical protein